MMVAPAGTASRSPAPCGATVHAALRAGQRYGLDPQDADWRSVILAITDSVLGNPAAACLLGRRANGRERWLVQLAGAAIVVIYAPETATVITVLPATAPPPPTRRIQHLKGRVRRERPVAEEFDDA